MGVTGKVRTATGKVRTRYLPAVRTSTRSAILLGLALITHFRVLVPIWVTKDYFGFG
jgi:hypothetical protein